MPLHRAKFAKQLSTLIQDEDELTDADVEILRDVLFSLQWSPATNALLTQQMIPVRELAAQEMFNDQHHIG